MAEQVAIAAKYGPYIEKQEAEVRRVQRVEERRLPDELDYAGILGHAQRGAAEVRPVPPGHRRARPRASAASPPSDIAVLLVALERRQAPAARSA